MQTVETVFFGPMLGELGWLLSRWHGYCRLRRFTEFENLRSMAVDYDWRYPIYADFIDDFVPLPKWVSELGWEQDCYELVPPDAQAGSATPADVYAQIIAECQQFYNPMTTRAVRTPRGCNFYIQFKCRQMWKTLEPSENARVYVESLLSNVHNDIVVVSARGRSRAADRNIPESTWENLVDSLTTVGFTVAIVGTKHSSFLTKKLGRNIINLIPIAGVDSLDVLIALLHKAKFSVTSQSGPTHISLQCETPSYIVGHESRRHSVDENYLNTPTMFRTVPNNIYAGLAAETMLEDILAFDAQLTRATNAVEENYKACYAANRNVMFALLREEPMYYEADVERMRKELINAK